MSIATPPNTPHHRHKKPEKAASIKEPHTSSRPAMPPEKPIEDPVNFHTAVEIGGWIAAQVDDELAASNGVRIDVNSSNVINGSSKTLGEVREGIRARVGFVDVALARNKGKLVLRVRTENESAVHAALQRAGFQDAEECVSVRSEAVVGNAGRNSYTITLDNNKSPQENKPHLEKIKAQLLQVDPEHKNQMGLSVTGNRLVINNPANAVRQLLQRRIKLQDAQRSR